MIDKGGNMETGNGPFKVGSLKGQIAITGGGIKEGMTGKIEEDEVLGLRSHEEKVTQLAFQLVTSDLLTGQIDDMLWLPAAAFRVDQEFIKGTRVGLGKG